METIVVAVLLSAPFPMISATPFLFISPRPDVWAIELVDSTLLVKDEFIIGGFSKALLAYDLCRMGEVGTLLELDPLTL